MTAVAAMWNLGNDRLTYEGSMYIQNVSKFLPN